MGMPDVFDGDGNVIGEIPLSVKQLALLESGEEISVIYHTPQLLRYLLGERSGSFSLHRNAERFITREPAAVKHFAELQKAIKHARENAG
jgi:hypothetical protein